MRRQPPSSAVLVAGMAVVAAVALVTGSRPAAEDAVQEALVRAWERTMKGEGIDSLGSSPTWHDLVFAFPLAMLAYTGLETVANLAEETRRPGVQLPKSLFGGIGAVVVVYVAIAFVGLMAFPVRDGATELGTTWAGAPLMGIVAALDPHLPNWFHTPLRVYVGLSGAFILLLAAATSVSGFGRLAYSLGEHGQLPRTFGRLHRRTLVSPQAVLASCGISAAIIIAVSPLERRYAFLASLFSFGVLLAFTAAQLAVIRLRYTDPGRRRPFKVPFNVRMRGIEVPLPSVFGAIATFTVWIAALWTHPAARYVGPVWLAIGLVVYAFVRHERGAGLFEHVASTDEQVVPEAEFASILVPMKLGEIGEEMVATAVKLAQERGSPVDALHVVKVPLELPLDAPMAAEEARAEESIAEAKALGADHDVEVRGMIVRSRAIGDAIVKAAEDTGADLIVLGSAPRWRRQSRFFSPTVDYVLKKAPCEVLIVAFPQGVLEQEVTPA